MADRFYHPMSPRFKDLTGKRFGKLTALGIIAQRIRKSSRDGAQYVWLCACDCGELSTTISRALASGNSQSCGCTRINRLTTHGQAGTPAHVTWRGMKSRCNDPSNVAFKHYGGRGISVCDRWNLFASFLEDMGQPPDGLEIDRIDNDGNYEKANCRWVTHTQNMQNTRIQKRKRESNATATGRKPCSNH